MACIHLEDALKLDDLNDATLVDAAPDRVGVLPAHLGPAGETGPESVVRLRERMLTRIEECMHAVIVTVSRRSVIDFWKMTVGQG